MTLYQRYKRLTLWNQLGVIASIVGILAFILTVVPLLIPKRSKPYPPYAKATLEEQINHFSKIAQAHQWQPPELPSGISDVVVQVGIPAEYPISMLSVTGEVAKAVSFNGLAAVNPYIKNNRLFVRSQNPFGNAENVVRMNDYMDSQLPTGWDGNYSANRFEVVDDKQTPVFRVFYQQPFFVIVEGVFVATNGDKTVAFGNDAMFVPANVPIDKIPKQKSWFVYPSNNYLSELAQ